MKQAWWDACPRSVYVGGSQAADNETKQPLSCLHHDRRHHDRLQRQRHRHHQSCDADDDYTERRSQRELGLYEIEIMTMHHLLAGQRGRCGQVSTLSLEAILVRLVVHRVLLAIVAGVGVRATYT